MPKILKKGIAYAIKFVVTNHINKVYLKNNPPTRKYQSSMEPKLYNQMKNLCVNYIVEVYMADPEDISGNQDFEAMGLSPDVEDELVEHLVENTPNHRIRLIGGPHSSINQLLSHLEVK